ncbi:hypothetical protein DFP92_12133 [Yoonia sediminilitoris]|uniref:Uncharacterized protein n=1 Tax=Yoonia sediminilitoris TaxID=1286148 RepID=A0A2T6K685_9RHOB|nr:hypothetical protein C8N45_12133 [Yoonia sediminilitoris]RCW89699.1 hypothetical protein DFP92_12133 [Yoonia sediminilitoris]
MMNGSVLRILSMSDSINGTVSRSPWRRHLLVRRSCQLTSTESPEPRASDLCPPVRFEPGSGLAHRNTHGLFPNLDFSGHHGNEVGINVEFQLQISTDLIFRL